MITYDPKEWFKLIVQFHKSDTFRILSPTMMLLGLVTAGVCYVEKKYISVEIPALTIFHQIAGFVISMVLVFRINTAYDRWWEGRKLWGALVNTSRNLAIHLSAFTPNSERKQKEDLHKLISNYPIALKEHLRDNNTDEGIEYTSSFKKETYLKINHKPNYIAALLTNELLLLTKVNKQSENDFLILSNLLNQLTDVCGACERIKNTPIPYSYSIFIKKMIFLYIITMPFTFGFAIGYWSVPIVMIMFYAFASLELISEEIEDPFGTDSNDLPTDELAARIRRHTREILLNDEN